MVTYNLQRSTRAKHMRIVIDQRGECTVIAPHNYTHEKIHAFVGKKAEWILRHQNARRKFKNALTLPRSRKDYMQKKILVEQKIKERIVLLNVHYMYTWNSISIRDQKSRWGSCSKKGNLQFNYRMHYLSEDLFDYIIVHELCHLQEHNHSKAFWWLVARTIPNHVELRKRLRTRYIF